MLAVDVHYEGTSGIVAGIAFDRWEDSAPSGEWVIKVENIADYEPGQFYKRELPCILELLNRQSLQPDCILIDGYVYLDGHSRPGLGKRLSDALNSEVPVIGVAKTRFEGVAEECTLIRGTSNRPLFITVTGLELERAKTCIQQMHGDYRLPTLLKRADQLCRAGLR